MTERLLPPGGDDGNEGLIPYEDAPMYSSQGMGQEEEADEIPWRRYISAFMRFKWVMVAVMGVGLLGAALAFRTGSPVYTAQGSIWIKTDGSRTGGNAGGPIESGGLLRQAAWLDLLRSGQVLDTVAVRERLYLDVPSDQDEEPFRTLSTVGDYRTGGYLLTVAPDGASWTLTTGRDEVVDQGAVGSPIGTSLGMQWTPPAGSLAAGATYRFGLVSPGQVGRDLNTRLMTGQDQQVNFIRVSLSDPDPEKAARVVNSILERFVEVADRLKRDDLDYRVQKVFEQLQQVEDSLFYADRALESFRVSTATLPSEQATAMLPGVGVTRENPVIDNFHRMRQEADILQRDRDRLAAVLEDVPNQGLRVQAFDIIPAASRSSQLSRALEDLVDAQGEVRSLEGGGLLDNHPEMVRARQQVQLLEQDIIPRVGWALVQELDEEIAQQQSMVAGTARELTAIPVRSIEESRLERQRASWSTLHADLQQRFQEARLAAASMVRDAELHDRAFPPQWPSSDQRMRLVLMILAASVGLSLGSAILLDRLDPKVRYPKQVTSEIGLEILGTVPRILNQRGRKARENRDQVLEAFRDLRLNLEYAYGSAGPLLVTISSPGQSEGKSLISTNLALAFAEMGKKTILVDGDTRRGDAHRLLGVQRKPGLTDVLQRTVEARDAIQVTEYAQLDYLASGSRMANSPELLGTIGAQRLFAWLRGRYQVILVDSPPLAAGSDAFVLSSITGNLAMVLRHGASDRGLVQARLESIHRLPIRVLGAIMNDVEVSGIYKYYGNYLPGYAAGMEDPGDEGSRSLLSDGGRAAD
jgi:polysaccharide biosynthesis transport protein